jgi:hypothetical protein
MQVCTLEEQSISHARTLFALAILLQKTEYKEEAQKIARECLASLVSLEESGTTRISAGVVVSIFEHRICEPSFLHTETARRRFLAENIEV